MASVVFITLEETSCSWGSFRVTTERPMPVTPREMTVTAHAAVTMPKDSTSRGVIRKSTKLPERATARKMERARERYESLPAASVSSAYGRTSVASHARKPDRSYVVG